MFGMVTKDSNKGKFKLEINKVLHQKLDHLQGVLPLELSRRKIDF